MGRPHRIRDGDGYQQPRQKSVAGNEPGDGSQVLEAIDKMDVTKAHVISNFQIRC
jgi:hypothetical protein